MGINFYPDFIHMLHFDERILNPRFFIFYPLFKVIV